MPDCNHCGAPQKDQAALTQHVLDEHSADLRSFIAEQNPPRLPPAQPKKD